MKKIKFLIFLLISVVFINGCSFIEKDIPPKELEILPEQSYDLIVYSAEPEGIAAAVSAARNGLDVLLVEKRSELGGLMTLGELNFIDMNYSKDKTLLTRGIFEEFHDKVDGTAFDIEKAKKVFSNMLGNEENITLTLDTDFEEVLMEDNKLIGLVLNKNGEKFNAFAKQLIDASIDADLAYEAGVPYTFAGEDIGEKDRQMGVTLVFELKNIEWSKVAKYLKNDGNPHTGANSKTAWGYTDEGYSYEPKDELMRMRGFNVARQENGNVLINALVIFGVDVLDEESKNRGIERAKEELNYIVPYINENFVGFENAELAGVAEELYIRESRHMIGEYQLTIDDVLENQDKWDKIALGSYPVDVQPTIKQTWGTVIGNPDRYAIPFRSLVPLKVDNLMVVGRAASYKSLAAGSARVIPVGMCEGEAAGVAAKLLVDNDLTPRELSKDKNLIGKMQEILKEQGAYLEDFEVADLEVMKSEFYPGVKTIRSLGLLDGGYSNDYRIDQVMGKWRFQNLLNRSLEKIGKAPDYYIEVSEVPTNSEFIIEIVKLFDPEISEYGEAVNILKNKKIIDENLESYFADANRQPLAGEVTQLVANLYNYLLEDK